MLRKIMSMMTVCAVLLTLAVLPASAELVGTVATVPHYNDFQDAFVDSHMVDDKQMSVPQEIGEKKVGASANKVESEPVMGVFGNPPDKQSHRVALPEGAATFDPYFTIVHPTLAAGEYLRFSTRLATTSYVGNNKAIAFKFNGAWPSPGGTAGFHFNPDGFIYCFGANTGIPYDLSTWYDIDFIFQQGTKNYELYVNGILARSASHAGISGSGVTSVQGRYGINGPGPMDIYADGVSNTYGAFPDADRVDLITSSLINFLHKERVAVLKDVTLAQINASLDMPEGAQVKYFAADGVTEITDTSTKMYKGMKIKITSASGERSITLRSDFNLFEARFEGTITPNGTPAGFNTLGNSHTTDRIFSGKSGILPKEATDQSASFAHSDATGTNLYLDKFVNYENETVTIAFNVNHGAGDIRFGMVVSEGTTTWGGPTLPILNGTAGIVHFGTVTDPVFIAPLELNRWNQVAIVFKLGTGLYDYYLNGEKILDNHVGGGTLNKIGRFRFQSNSDSPTGSELFLDDIRIYNGAYDPEVIRTEITVDGYTLSGKNILVDEVVSVADFMSKVTATKGTLLGLYNSDVSAKKESGNVEIGDVVIVRAEEGFGYYTISSGNSVVDTVYSLEGNVIRGIPFYTTAQSIIDGVETLDPSATKEVVTAGGTPVTGLVETGMKLKITLGSNVREYDLELLDYHSYDDYTGHLGYRVSRTEPDTSGSGLPFTGMTSKMFSTAQFIDEPENSYAIVESDSDKSEYIRFYGTGNTVYNQQVIYKSFAAGAVTGKFVVEGNMMNPDNNTEILLHLRGDRTGGAAATFWSGEFIKLKVNNTISFLGQEVQTYETGKWYHVLTVYDLDAHSAKFYVDGVLVADYADLSEIGIARNDCVREIRIQNRIVTGTPSGAAFDDIMLYSYGDGSLLADEIDCTITSDDVYIDIPTKQIKIDPDGKTLEDLIGLLTFNDNVGNIKAFTSNGVETDNMSEALTEGFVIRVTSPDGRITCDWTVNSDTIVKPVSFYKDGVITKAITEDGEFTAKTEIIVFKASKDIEGAALVSALYDGNEMTNVVVDSEPTESGTSYYTKKSFEADLSISGFNPFNSIRAFFWNGFVQMQPLVSGANLAVVE